VLYTSTSAPCRVPRFTPHAAGLPIPTWGVEEQKALPGAAAAVLAHDGDGGRLNKS